MRSENKMRDREYQSQDWVNSINKIEYGVQLFFRRQHSNSCNNYNNTEEL